MSYTEDLIRYISASPTAFQAVEEQKEMLLSAGFTELKEEEKWNLRLSGSYFVTRNSSALIAFRIPKKMPEKTMIVATHADSPAFKVKTDPEMTVAQSYVKLNVEAYGGAVYSSWFDRPLSVAGRVFVKDGDGAIEIPVDLKKDLCMIPSLAIHMDRDTNKGHEIKVQEELLPLLSSDKDVLLYDLIAKKLKRKREEILSADLFVYNRQEAVIWGAKKEFLSSPRLDDLSCAYASVRGLIETKKPEALALHVMFNHEEVGSSSTEGACSTFLKDTLERIAEAIFKDRESYLTFLAKSLLLSADNGHALHPNYPEKCDPTNRPVMGKGVLLKFSGNQKYTTDASSAAKVKLLAEKAGISLQTYHNHSDLPGGSTLGNLCVHQMAIQAADIGIAQLAMHSSYETCAVSDLSDLYRLLSVFFVN